MWQCTHPLVTTAVDVAKLLWSTAQVRAPAATSRLKSVNRQMAFLKIELLRTLSLCFKVSSHSANNTTADAAGSGVEESNDNEQQHNVYDNDDNDDAVESSSSRFGHRRRSSSSDNPTDTIQMTFGHNTLETLPHADHYRNILSASGGCRLQGIRQRPTLMELHEQDAQVK